MQACDRADFLVTCSCFQQEKPAKDCHNCLTCDFGIIKKVFWKCRIFPDTLSLSLQLMYFTVSLSVRLLRLSSKIDISPSSSLYLWWNHQLFCRIVFNLQFIGEAQCFGRKRFFPTVTGSQSQVYLMQPLFSAVKYRSGAVLIASGKAADTRGWQFIICLSGTSICLQPWERWACLID